MIGRRETLCFAAGDLGFNFVWQSIELYLLFFYVNTLGFSPAAAAAIFLAGAAVDWVADPAIGALADRLSSRVRLRSWVVVGGPAASALLVAVFAQPMLGGSLPFSLALLLHLLLRAAYSLGNIPYAALTARISTTAADHVRLTGARMQGAALGGLIAALAYLLAPPGAGGGTDFAFAAMLLALLAQPAFAATFLGVIERAPATVAPRQPVGHELAGFAALVLHSTELRRLLSAIFFAGLSVTLLNKSILFLFQEQGTTRLGFAAAVLPALSLLLSVPLWVALARSRGAVRTLVIGAMLNAIAVAAIAGAAAFAVVPALAAGILAGVVAGHGMSVMFWSLVPAAVQRLEREGAGEARVARVYALASIARKMAQACAPQFVALGLLVSQGKSVVPGLLVAALLTLGAVLAYPPRQDAG